MSWKGTVTILGEPFKVEAPTDQKARKIAARLYQEKFGKKYPLGMLKVYSSIDKENREKPGVRSIYDKELLV